MKKSKKDIGLGILLALMLCIYLTGCGSDSATTESANLSEEGYKALCVGDGCGQDGIKAVGKNDSSNKTIIVLPASIDAPSDAVTLPGATITFVDDSSELGKIKADSRGYFEIPADVLSSTKFGR